MSIVITIRDSLNCEAKAGIQFGIALKLKKEMLQLSWIRAITPEVRQYALLLVQTTSPHGHGSL